MYNSIPDDLPRVIAHTSMDSEKRTSNCQKVGISFNFLIVHIKWNGKPVENITACEGHNISSLKRVIEDSCGVPIKKQKLLFKGKFLKVIYLLYVRFSTFF